MEVLFSEGYTYPAQLVNENGGVLPVIGEGDLVRVDILRQMRGGIYLADPFTSAVFRKTTSAELKLIGRHSAVIERYNYLSDHQIALTFDDGPSPYTSQILDVLERNHVPATFFAIGNNVLTTSGGQQLIRREAADGDMIGGHTLTHIEFNAHGSVRDREEDVATQRVLRTAANIYTRVYRLPYGTEEKSPLAILTSQQLGLQELSYDLDTEDWYYQSTSTTKLVPVPKLDGQGHVVVMHDGGGNRQQTVFLVQKLIDEARAAGYTFVTMSPLLPRNYIPTPSRATFGDHITSTVAWVTLDGWQGLLNNVMQYTTAATVGLTLFYVCIAWCRNYFFQRRVVRRYKKLFPVSIIVPAYNEAKGLLATLINLQVALEHYPLESEVLLVVNDCTDHTAEIAEKFACTWPALRVLYSAPGKAAALNLGDREARYDVVVHIDADTKLTAETLMRITPHFADERIGGVAGRIVVGNRIKGLSALLTLFQKTEYLLGTCIDKQALGVAVGPGAGTAYWRSRLLEVGGNHGNTKAEDFDLTLRVRGRRGSSRRHVIQDVHAVFLTEAPDTLRSLWLQRVRWSIGTLQTCRKNLFMIRPQYGWHGLFLLPYIIMSQVLALVFLPLMFFTMAFAIIGGNWQGIALLFGFSSVINLLMVLAATIIAKEKWTVHLLVVPIYRLVDALLRMCVIFVTLVQAIRGPDTQWFSPERKNSVAPVMVTSS